MNTSITQISKNELAVSSEKVTPSLLRDRRGLSTVEYIILLVIIVVGCVALWQDIGGDLINHLTVSHEKIETL